MSLIDIARDAIKELPISDIVRERLSLAVDRLAEAEAKISELEQALGSAKAAIERELQEHHQTRLKLQRLEDEHSEEIRIHRFIEFRRGKRTNGRWAAFCPKCHLPIANDDGFLLVKCSDQVCKWQTKLSRVPLSLVLKELDTGSPS